MYSIDILGRLSLTVIIQKVGRFMPQTQLVYKREGNVRNFREPITRKRDTKEAPQMGQGRDNPF